MIEPPSGGDPGIQASCAAHPRSPAAGVCERCGDFMCRLCTTMVEGRAYCPKCFDLLYHRGSLRFTQAQFSLPAICLTLGIVSVLSSACGGLCLLGFPLSLVTIVLGARALKEHGERPDLPNRGLTLAGIWLGGAGVLVSLAWVVLFVARWLR